MQATRILLKGQGSRGAHNLDPLDLALPGQRLDMHRSGWLAQGHGKECRTLGGEADVRRFEGLELAFAELSGRDLGRAFAGKPPGPGGKDRLAITPRPARN